MTLQCIKTLKIDDKWSVEFDVYNNDRPTRLLRHGEPHVIGCGDWKNDQVAMFYALLAAERGNWDIEEYRIWPGIDKDKPYWGSLQYSCSTWTDANSLLEEFQRVKPAQLFRVVHSRRGE